MQLTLPEIEANSLSIRFVQLKISCAISAAAWLHCSKNCIIFRWRRLRLLPRRVKSLSKGVWKWFATKNLYAVRILLFRTLRRTLTDTAKFAVGRSSLNETFSPSNSRRQCHHSFWIKNKAKQRRRCCWWSIFTFRAFFESTSNLNN